MTKAFKKTVIPLLLAILILGNESFWESKPIEGCLEVVYGKTNYIDVDSYNSWLSELTRAKKNLEAKVSVSIARFDEKVYNIEKLSEYNISITGQGEIIGKRAYIDYTFTYSDNYMLLRALESPELQVKLNEEQLSVLNIIKADTASLINENMTDYEKEKAIHDFMVSTYQYDIENLTANTLTLRSHSTVGLVKDKKGVCEAYANTFMLMCKTAGIECDVITGTVDDTKHAWNVVRLEDEYYHVDVTNDDPAPDVAGRIRYNYFNLNDEQIQQTHIIDEPYKYKCTGEKYNYYTFNNLIVSDYDQLRALAERELVNGKNEFTFKTQNFILYSSTYINKAVSGKGFSRLSIYGDFGKDNIYQIILE